ncbi:proteasome ATPase [Janibacter limosus]|uniref:AAA ATPase forming ring-shaped complexes n=1 Tax=Janibacter limosus TaxID=53458 RepID=A0A4P6MTI3_9MICO|nr:proteasome ATPase [Janibacter limosus]QBF46072.1 proteasome ATPase [Janibacter limosus]
MTTEPSPQDVRALQDKLAHQQSQMSTVASQNERLVRTLKDARQQIVSLREEIERLAQPPSSYAVIVDVHDADNTVDVLSGGRKMHVAVSPAVESSELGVGREVRLNEAMNVVSVHAEDVAGEVVVVKEVLDEDRLLVLMRQDEERVVRRGTRVTGKQVRVGDAVLVDQRSNIAVERIPRAEVADLVLEEVPDLGYDDIGGLSAQIEAIRDSVELPYLHADLYERHKLKAPKGVLLYGPPGNGKTMIAKAVAASLARKVAERTGQESATAYFLNIKGPELLNKYVGETERHIRLIFHRAREKSSDGTPVVVFFDEMDSLFRTRGSGVSSDVETTIVPQLLAEIDGVEGLDNVIVIGATNREDMIDPAILRPGRLDVKIKIERPDAEGARDIFSKYLTADLPLHPEDLEEHDGDRQATVAGMIDAAVEHMYAESDANQFLEVTYQGGDKEILYFKDFNSGAMIQNIVDRSKKAAIKDFLTTGTEGIRVGHVLDACIAEFKENEDLPNTTNPDDWAKISGKKGERIVYIRTLIGGKTGGAEPGRSIDTGSRTGQYL